MYIEIITMAYNDEKLLPFILDHYRFADTIHVVIDSATIDDSEKICKSYSNVDVSYITFPDGFDDFIKQDKIKEIADTCKDWIINIDTDEFAFCNMETSLESYLRNTDANLVYVNFWMVYRNRVEQDLDWSKPALLQRRYGDPNQGVNYGFACFNKPLIVKKYLNPQWGLGNHSIGIDQSIAVKRDTINGVHWAMADVDIAVERRMNQKKRQSTRNRTEGLAIQHHFITEEEIRTECFNHLNDPRLF